MSFIWLTWMGGWTRKVETMRNDEFELASLEKCARRLERLEETFDVLRVVVVEEVGRR